MTFKQLLRELDACQEAIDWVEDKTIEQAVEQCDRGDWFRWLASKIEVDFNIVSDVNDILNKRKRI